MNIKDKFMQMIMIGMDIDKFNDEVIKLIRDYKVGGVVLYKKNYNSIDIGKFVACIGICIGLDDFGILYDKE